VHERSVRDAADALIAEGALTRALGESLREADAGRVVWDDWTVKDVLGHVAASHAGLLRRMQGTIPAAARGQTLAEINEQRRRDRAGWPLARVLDEIEVGRAADLTYLAGQRDDLERPVAFTGGRTVPLYRVAWLLSAHEREHREEIEAALGRGHPGRGRVAWLNISAGGVPKLPIRRAELGEHGLAGDGHTKPMHGGPTAALCLLALEVIQTLQGEGHPIFPGAIGENVTVAGLDWARIQPGDRLRIGPTLVEITRFTTPCVNIAGAFKDGAFARVLQAQHPGQARVYARVIETGSIAVGDPIEHLAANP
jgi:MOSC domain-containing protein YiiM